MLIIGVDEAGRGPLAGPVTVGAFAAEEKTGKKILKNIFGGKLRDSKKLTPKRREEIYKEFLKMKKAGEIDFKVAHSSPAMIDKRGISWAINLGIKKCLEKLEHENQNYNGAHCNQKKCGVIRLDGGLKAPAKFKKQETIIKGDEKDVWIACASVVAKVSRDRLMCRLAKKFPKFYFDVHKGYGTSLHYRLIRKFGLSEIHRKTFLKNLILSPSTRRMGREKSNNS